MLGQAKPAVPQAFSVSFFSTLVHIFILFSRLFFSFPSNIFCPFIYCLKYKKNEKIFYDQLKDFLKRK